MGDIHYSGNNYLKQEDFEFAYYEIFNKNKAQSNFYRSQPLSQIFDDHDFGSNNAESSSLSNSKVNAAYRASLKKIDTEKGSYHSYITPTGKEG